MEIEIFFLTMVSVILQSSKKFTEAMRDFKIFVIIELTLLRKKLFLCTMISVTPQKQNDGNV